MPLPFTLTKMIGQYLVSCDSFYDFGYLSLSKFCRKTYKLPCHIWMQKCSFYLHIPFTPCFWWVFFSNLVREKNWMTFQDSIFIFHGYLSLSVSLLSLNLLSNGILRWVSDLKNRYKGILGFWLTFKVKMTFNYIA